MKIIYLALSLVFSMALSAQEPQDLQNQNEEIVGFKLYPNPVYESVVYMTSAENGPKIILVYDVFGEVVLTERVTSNALNISRLVPGVYVLHATEGNKTITRKLVVK